MTIRYLAPIGIFVAALAGGLIWTADHYHGLYLGEKTRADTAEHSLVQANAAITTMQERQQAAAELDAKHTQELADANTKNDALQRKLDAGGRVRVAGKCAVSGTDKTASTGSVGDDAAIELSDTAGRNVLGIRTGILSDQQKVKYLQDYINTQCHIPAKG